MTAALVTASAFLMLVAGLCFRMSRLHLRLASAYRLIAELIPEDDMERRTLLSLAERDRVAALR